MSKRVKSLQKVSKALGTSMYLTRKIRDYIADSIRREYRDWDIPNYAIFGENGYSIKRFNEVLKENDYVNTNNKK
jgi:hypothetical protein